MPKFASPLRYPGGKAGLTRFLGAVIQQNGLGDCVYVEPFAGGAGAALALLYGEHVSKIVINDFDPSIFAFWQSVLARPKQFLAMVDGCELTVEFWKKQKAIYSKPKSQSRIRLGFSAFYLNRCNRSGIICNGGPIGGHDQSGRWKIDARFNRATIRERIERIQSYRDRVQASNTDAITLLTEYIRPLAKSQSVLVYLDPPYYRKGPELYLNAYEHDDHERLSKFLQKPQPFRWIMTYDNVPEIRKLYSDFPQKSFSLSYSAYDRREGQELLVHDESLLVPRGFRSYL